MKLQPPATAFDQTSNLDGRAVHEVALYDPAAHDDQIVVMFETPADAQAALDRLTAEGLAGDAAITERTADGANAGVNSEGGNTGFWGAMKGLFAPDAEVHGLAEGVNRGHALLVLHPAIETRTRVIEVLEASNPIDFDARLEHWRTAGWQALHDQQATQAASLERPRTGVRDTTRGGTAVRSYFAPRLGQQG